MGKQFHLTLYDGYNYFPMHRFKLNDVNKMSPDM